MVQTLQKVHENADKLKGQADRVGTNLLDIVYWLLYTFTVYMLKAVEFIITVCSRLGRGRRMVPLTRPTIMCRNCNPCPVSSEARKSPPRSRLLLARRSAKRLYDGEPAIGFDARKSYDYIASEQIGEEGHPSPCG